MTQFKPITAGDIIFGEPRHDKPNSAWQDIMLGDENIGALRSSYKGLLSTITELYQMGVMVTPEIEAKYTCVESDDIGWSFVQFDTLEAFLDFYNNVGRHHNKFQKIPFKEYMTRDLDVDKLTPTAKAILDLIMKDTVNDHTFNIVFEALTILTPENSQAAKDGWVNDMLNTEAAPDGVILNQILRWVKKLRK